MDFGAASLAVVNNAVKYLSSWIYSNDPIKLDHQQVVIVALVCIQCLSV